jgi:glycosyltransferase involved in cell wall biosynthesis
MTALHITSGRLFGGVEQMLVTIAKCRHITPDVHVRFAVAAPGRLEQELRDVGVEVTLLGDVRLSRPASVLQARARLARWLDEHEKGNDESLVVICHAPWAYTLFAPVVRRRGVPVVLWQHTHASGRSMVERLGKQTRADLVICNSRWTTGSSSALQDQVPSAVIHPPVLLSPASTDRQRARAELRHALQLSPDAVVIFTASRLEPGKGHRQLLQAVSRLVDRPDWILCIAGGFDRPEEKRYQMMLDHEVSELGLTDRVRFLGERRDVSRLMRGVDVLCQANELPDAFGIVFAEALLSGVPVVTPCLGGAPEIVADTCGRLVPPGDVQALSDALRELIEHPALRRQLGANGHAHAAARVAPEIVLPQLARTLESLAGALSTTTRAVHDSRPDTTRPRRPLA